MLEESKTTYYQYDTNHSSSSSSEESHKNVKQISILDKVNEIIKSCVRLRDEKQMTGEKLTKANLIIEKAKEKEKKILKQLGDKIKKENSPLSFPQLNREPGELEQLDVKPVARERSVSLSASLRTRSDTRSSSRSSRTWRRDRRSPSRRSRSNSRARGRAKVRARSRSRSVPLRGRSRSRSRRGRRSHWIAVSPCVLQDDVTLERNTTRFRVPAIFRFIMGIKG